MNWIDILKRHKAPVTEVEWQRIVHDPAVVRFNRARRVRRWMSASLGAAVLASAVVLVVMMMSRPSTEPLTKNDSVQEPVTKQSVVTTMTDQPTSPISEPLSPTVSQPSVEKTPALRTPSAAENSVPSTMPITTPAVVKTSTPVSTSTPAQKPMLTTTASATSASTTKAINTTPKTQPSQSLEEPDPSNEPETPWEEPQEERFFVPNSFTPNGDGLNDLFKVVTNYDPKVFEMAIYSRSGELVFNTRNINIGWDGDKQPAGLYNYVVKYSNMQGKTLTKRGQVMMLK